MRYLALMTAGAIVLAAGATANAAPVSPAGISAPAESSILLVQDKKAAKKAAKPMKMKMKKASSKPMKMKGGKKKMKGAMKRMKGKMMGWEFTAHCVTGTMSCHKGGQSQWEAKNACILSHPGCFIADSK